MNGQPVTDALQQGYLVIDREWKAGDIVELDLPMPVRLVRGNEKIAATKGQVAFERGPIVYCVEAVQQSLPAAPLAPPLRTTLSSSPQVFHSAVTIKVEPLHAPAFTAIPYYAWNNRGLAPMEVWLPEASSPAVTGAKTP